MSYANYNEFQNLCKPSRIVTSSYKFIPKNVCNKQTTFFNTYKYPYIYANPTPYVKPINFANQKLNMMQNSDMEFQTTSNQFGNPIYNYHSNQNQLSDASILNQEYNDPGIKQQLDDYRSYN